MTAQLAGKLRVTGLVNTGLEVLLPLTSGPAVYHAVLTTAFPIENEYMVDL